MSRLKVAVVGCGGAATGHALALANLADFEIVALVDPSERNLASFRTRVPAVADVPAYADVEQLYDAGVEVEALTVVTPHTLHHPIVVGAIKRNLHVLCEKPLTCDPAHAREIESAAATAGVTVMVRYQRRFDPAYRYMREVITSGELGELRSIMVSVGQRWLKNTVGTWRQDPALSGGGMLMDSGSHLADMLLWLVGKPVETVSALVDNAGSPVDINTAATVSFAGGVQGQLHVVGDLATTWMENVAVSGTNGLLRYEADPQHPWRTGRVVHYRDGELVQPVNLPEPPEIHQALLATIRDGAVNEAPPAAGIAVAELSEAIYRSAGQGGARISLR
ncbi:Gfo/Idh/MocA family protein [Actinopolymorpha singaporensis]|uniref:Predicted dehydrogenase n=1 Tax=Actinopolymorpha singaporensis TaxID=117157 RepID=A0A1H1MCP5_9ACTN|nr:Gfo/Idh/MocA family oxidoreductase [Actinopolymorpha singaporensis]SDR84563.1 Predicted dehydrogenase [Actinopolymorpha singaporensis]